MASTLSNSAAVKAVGDFLRKSTAYNYPLDAGVIDNLIYAGVTLGPGVVGGDTGDSTGTTGATKDVLKTYPTAGLLNLIVKYSGGGSFDLTPIKSAINLLLTPPAYERPVDDMTIQLVRQFAKAAGFSYPQGALSNEPYTTLIYLLYWTGTVSPSNPYA